jgi:hypothetical protein
MSHPSLRLAAARFVLELATTEELIDAAHDALNDGVYTYSLGELATLRQPTMAEAGPLFVASLKELEIRLPTVGTAVEEVLSDRAVVIAEELIPSHVVVEGLAREAFFIELSCRSLPQINETRTFSDLIQELEGYYYQFGEYRDYSRYDRSLLDTPEVVPIISTLNSQCINMARDWCRARWQPHLDTSWLTTTVRSLARGIHDEHAYDRLPILADALQEAGCENDDILDHCRRARTHHQWCWVIDLLLSR